jgi:DNA invertase Pin-like site-specific DNA recombinase
MRYFYGRVSDKTQNLARQLEEAKKRKCDKIFMDKESGKNFDRLEFQRMKQEISSGDELFVLELDRLGRNKIETKQEMEWLKSNNIKLRIIELPTTMVDFQGQDWVQDMVNNILIEVYTSIAEQERIKIKKRQKEGIACAKAQGVKFGRPQADVVIDKPKDETVSEYCARMGISRSTYYKYAN